MDTTEQLLLEWPLTAGTDDTVGAAVNVRNYQPAHFLQQQPPAHVRQYTQIAPTPEMEMSRWISIVESWMNAMERKTKQLQQKKQMLTEVDPLAAQRPIEGPPDMMDSRKSALFEIDPVAQQQPLHTRTIETTKTVETTYAHSQIPVDQQLRDITTKQVHGEARTQPFWHEIDPKTGKAVDEKKSEHPLNNDLAGWKIL